VIAVVLLVLFALACAVASFVGIMLAFVSDSCNGSNCDTGLIATGMLVTAVVPWAIWLLTLILTIVWFARSKKAWWLPLVGAIAAGVAAGIGIAIAFAGAPSGF
jgi:hypothetical protein